MPLPVPPSALLALGLALAPTQEAPPSSPDGSRPPRMAYDARRERTLQGAITAVTTDPRGPGDLVVLTVQAEGATWRVRTAPRAVLARLGAAFAAGDAVTVVGLPVSGPEGQGLLARQITRGATTWTLLDAQGRPAVPPQGAAS